jgi:acyl carrier protein
MTTQQKSQQDENKILKLLSEYLGIERKYLLPQADLESDLNLQPLDLVDLISHFNQGFQIDIDPEEASAWKSVADILHTVSEKIMMSTL